MENAKLAGLFQRLADALELLDENPFKIVSYRKASRALENLTEDIREINRKGELRSIPGVGEGIEKKIREYFQTGTIKKLKEAERKLSPALIDMLSIQGLGPRTLSLARKKLKVKNLTDLEKAITSGKLAGLPGMGEKKAENILKGIEIYKKARERMPLGKVFLLVEKITEELRKVPLISSISPAGSFRRMKESIGDIDILASAADPAPVMDAFISLEHVKRVLSRGRTKCSVLTKEDVQVDLRVVAEESFGAALQYFTGSKEHNVALRGLAREKGLKINEYGVYRGEKRIAGRTEEEVYASLNMDYIPPEMRENLGEIEKAVGHTLPALVEYGGFPGEFHVHSPYSDGLVPIEGMVQAAEKRGYSFIGIADHSKSARYAGGLSVRDLERRNREIDRIGEKHPFIRILKGMEVDILPDGRLDYPDDVLRLLDYVIAAVHTGLNTRTEERLLKAMDNPFVTMIAHPTGRLLGLRESAVMDREKLFKKAADKKIAMEINSHYNRLDLDDHNCRLAQKHGVRFAVNTDSHDTETLWQIRLGIGVARRAGLSSSDIINFDPSWLPRKKR